MQFWQDASLRSVTGSKAQCWLSNQSLEILRVQETYLRETKFSWRQTQRILTGNLVVQCSE